ncbi:50S ribosomal protein L9 [Bacteroidota bacterium]|nr:50S ribosomal protein L9 [Bacteroidota bacterium]
MLVTVQIPKAMQVILLRDMDKLGDRFDIVAVKNGYGRNFLIPQGIAQIANKINLANLEEIKKIEEAEELQRLGDYRAIASQLTSQTLKIGAKAGASGKIFGSVTSVQIAAAIKEQFGLEILRKKIELPAEVKELGTYTAIINLHKEVIGKVEFEVSAE